MGRTSPRKTWSSRSRFTSERSDHGLGAIARTEGVCPIQCLTRKMFRSAKRWAFAASFPQRTGERLLSRHPRKRVRPPVPFVPSAKRLALAHRNEPERATPRASRAGIALKCRLGRDPTRDRQQQTECESAKRRSRQRHRCSPPEYPDGFRAFACQPASESRRLQTSKTEGGDSCSVFC